MSTINIEREKLTQDEFEFHQRYHDKGIQIVPPAYIFKNRTYSYEERALKLNELSPELRVLVAVANKFNMCIKAQNFVFAPPQTNDELQKEIASAVKHVVAFAEQAE
ncbi:MAG: hypothetical protein IJY92_05925 [Alphaproteobacteria bacterium]|nr:hypothetical protein [Alphaproteobacteria bacterium]